MAFCGNCGFEVPEGMKFCPNCGTAVFDLNSANTLQEEEAESLDMTIEDWQPRPHRIPQMDTRAMQDESDQQPKKRRKGKTKRSVPWMIVAIVSLILGIVAWIIPSDVATWIIMTIALASAIVSLCMKAKFRAISIISIVVSGILVFLWLIQGIMYLRDPHEPKEVSCGQVNISIPAKYLVNVNETYDQDTYTTRDDNAAFMIVRMNQSFSEGQFDNWSGMISRAIRETLVTRMTITGSSAARYREIGGLKALQFEYTGEYTGEDILCKVIFINDISSQNSTLLAHIYAAEAEEKYGKDFDEVVNGIWVGKSYGSSASSDKSSSSGGSIFSTGGVDPQLKAALDEYEAFVDEYVEFMKKYQADPNNAIGMISDYSSMLTRLAEFSNKINGYDTSKMSKEDYAYYLDVLNRVEKKMLDVAY